MSLAQRGLFELRTTAESDTRRLALCILFFPFFSLSWLRGFRLYMVGNCVTSFLVTSRYTETNNDLKKEVNALLPPMHRLGRSISTAV